MPGPNEISCRSHQPLPANPEDAIGQAAGTESQVATRGAAPREAAPDAALLDGQAALVHAAEIFGAFEETAAGAAMASVTLPLAAGAIGLMEIIEADEEAHRRGEVYAQAKKQGALLVLEGRDRGPEVATLRASLAGRDDHDSQMRLAGLLDGMAAANRFLDERPCEGRELVRRTRLAMNEGQAAVANGTDRGEPFERRAAGDPAFRDGADYMRRLRTEHPADFEARAERIQAMARDVAEARRTNVRM